MSKNHILEVGDLIEYKIRGLITPTAMHNLAWELNSVFQFDLQRTEDHEVKASKSNSFHILYKAILEEESDLFLVQNRGISGLILPQYQMIDAILVERNYDGEFIPNFLEKIQTPSIQLCLDINFESLSDIEKQNIEIG
jgi:hypothetical protein